MQVSVLSDIKRAAKDVRRLGSQGEFAQIVALTRTALDVRTAEQQEMRSVFDRPTPYTLNSLYVETAGQRLNTLVPREGGGQQLVPTGKRSTVAEVGIKDDESAATGIAPVHFIGPNIDGGSRNIKRFEKRLQLDGVMPRGWLAVPGQFAKLDAFGNLSRGQITQILSQLTTTKVSGYTANISAKSRKGAIKRAGGEFIALPKGRGKLLPGIYQVTQFHSSIGRSAPRPIVIFVKSVAYRRRLDFFGVAETAANVFYPGHLETALAQYAGRNQVN